MGAVYLAHDDMLQRDVALKTIARLPPALANEFRARFLNEARCVAALTHPNIVPVYDLGIEDGVPFLVMEVVSGASLQGRLADGVRLDAAAARSLGIQIGNALAEAHRAGILHRDVKPANVLDAGSGTWKLADFGIARAPDSSLTVQGQFLGTPTYAAPETLSDAAFSPAADVWGLGATVYEALCGTPPYGRGNGLEIALEATQRPPPSLRERAPDVPADLAAVVMAALAHDPTQRPSAAELAQRFAVGGAPAAEAVPRVPRWRAFPAVLVAAAAAITALGVLAYHDDATQRPTASASSAAFAPAPAVADPAPLTDTVAPRVESASEAPAPGAPEQGLGDVGALAAGQARSAAGDPRARRPAP